MVNENSLQAEALEKFTDVFLEIPFNRMLGLRLESYEDGEITIRFLMKEELIGNYLHGILHGGVISSVLDMAGGAAAMVSVVQKTSFTNIAELAGIIGKSSTIDLHVSYIRPGKGSEFVAKARIMHTGNKISFAQMELYNDQSILIASGTGTYLIG